MNDATSRAQRIRPKNTHSVEHVLTKISGNRLYQSNLWRADNTMNVVISDTFGLIITCNVAAERYTVAPAQESQDMQAILDRCPELRDANGYRQEELGELLRFVRRELIRTAPLHEQPKLPFQEGVDARARGRAGQREL